MTEEVKQRARGVYFAVLKSKEADSNYSVTLESNTRKELAQAVAAAQVGPGGGLLELVIAVRGKKLQAQEQRTVNFV
jgi:hypothetical protein